MVACAYGDFPTHFGLFLPLAGITTVRRIAGNAFDIRATSRLNRLYVKLLEENPEWARPIACTRSTGAVRNPLRRALHPGHGSRMFNARAATHRWRMPRPGLTRILPQYCACQRRASQ